MVWSILQEVHGHIIIVWILKSKMSKAKARIINFYNFYNFSN